jgi:hypothetical protein
MAAPARGRRTPPRARGGYFSSSAQTAVVCTARSRLKSAPLGGGMLSVVVTERLPSAVAATHWA